MTTDQIGIVMGIVSGIVGIVTGLAGLGHSYLLQTTRLAKMEVKVDTLWEFLMRRAGVEAVNKGIASINSPLRVHDHAVATVEPLRNDLEQLYASLSKPVRDTDLMLAIEKQLGGRLVKEICIPHSWSLGECLFAAAALAKGDNTIVLPDLVM